MRQKNVLIERAQRFARREMQAEKALAGIFLILFELKDMTQSSISDGGVANKTGNADFLQSRQDGKRPVGWIFKKPLD